MLAFLAITTVLFRMYKPVLFRTNLVASTDACLRARSERELLLCDLNLTQLVTQSTHVKGNTLDLVITDLEDSVTNLDVVTCNSCSDHYHVFFSILSGIPQDCCVDESNQWIQNSRSFFCCTFQVLFVH